VHVLIRGDQAVWIGEVEKTRKGILPTDHTIRRTSEIGSAIVPARSEVVRRANEVGV
jgi:hypothetical protein